MIGAVVDPLVIVDPSLVSECDKKKFSKFLA